MSDILNDDQVADLKRAAVNMPRSRIDNWAMQQLIGNLRVQRDPFGIYAQRKLLSKAMPGVAIYRGDEWWTSAADKIIRSDVDRNAA